MKYCDACGKEKGPHAVCDPTPNSLRQCLEELMKHKDDWPMTCSPRSKKALEDRENPEPKSRTGVCVGCNGIVMEHFTRVSNAPDIIGGNHGFHWKSSGLACVDCGLMYAKLPPEKKAKKRKK